MKDARRSVTGPLSAASTRYLRIGDSGFGAVKARFLDFFCIGAMCKTRENNTFRGKNA